MTKDDLTSKPKQREWGDYINDRIDFLTDHWTKDDREPFNFGGWRDEVVSGIANKITKTLQAQHQQTLKEIVESMERFEHINKLVEDRIGGWSWLKSTLKARLEGKK